MKKLIFGIILLVVHYSPTFAEQSRKVLFRTLCLEQIENLETLVVPTVKNPRKDQEIVLSTVISEVTEATFENNEAIFYWLNAGPDGKLVRVAVGKATLGKSESQLFVFAPNREQEVEGVEKFAYHVHVFDDDLKSFALGNIRAVNLTSVPLQFVIPDATIPSILPGEFALFPHTKTVNEYNMYPVTAEFQEDGGEWVKGYKASWKSTDSRREVVIASEDPETKVRSLRIFSDFPPN